MLKLILGGAGTGKTHCITEMIKKDIEEGRCAFLIVPEQETVLRERMMLKALPPSAQLSFEVLNFSRLANSVFRKYGGLTYNYVSGPVKSLAMWNTLRALSPLLSEYGGEGGDPHFSEMMLSQIEEFKAYCVSPSAIERAASNAPEGSRLGAKLSDLALVYSSYSSSLSECGGGDASDDIGKLAKKLDENNFFAGTNVYIDSFTSFTASENEVLSKIIRQADNVTASFCLRSDSLHDELQFDSVADTVRRFRSLAEKCGKSTEHMILNENHRTCDKALRRLSEDIWRFDAPTAESDEYRTDSVKLVKCTNVYEEAEAVCTEIAKLVRDGMRYRDIVILARNVQSYEGIIDNALEKADIPYFMSKGEDVTSIPLAKLLLCALRIKNNLWRTEDVITYIKTGLTGLDERSIDLFEQYIWKWSISGKAFLGDDWTMDPDSYSAEPSERGRAVLDTVNMARRALISPLIVLFEKIDAAVTNEDICRAVFEYMEELSLSDKMRELAASAAQKGDAASASVTLRLYNTVLDVLGLLAETDCGEERYSSADFEQALRIALAGTSLQNIPTSCDEVTVGSASLLRADRPRCVIMIGVLDGVFPENVSDVGMLSDDEKQFLIENGIELSGGSDERASEELFYIYRAVSAPSEKLIMTYPASELQGGGELRPSLAFERTRLLLSTPVVDYSALPLSEKIWSEKTAFEYMPFADAELADTLKSYFEGKEEYSLRLDSLYTPICDRECSVPSELSELIFGRHMSFSPSALEKYVKCHFDYWCEYVLKLRPDEKNIFRLSDTGSLIHALLENFIRAVTDENGFNATLADDEIEEMLRELLRLYAEANIPEKDLKKEQVSHVLSKLLHLSRLLAGSVTAELKKSRFVPTFFELKISDKDENAVKPMTISLPDGSTVSVRGIVDRVDLLKEGNDVYVKVVDYKTGAKQFSLSDVKEGLGLQMLLYLFTICEDERNKRLMGCPDDGELKSAGVVYLSSRIKSVEADSATPADEVHAEADKRLVRSGMLLSDEKVLGAVNEDMDFRYILSDAKSEKRKKEVLRSEDEFCEIKDMITETLRGIFTSVREGDAGIEPKEHDGRLPCEYCRMRAVCRRAEHKKDEEVEE
ncbi:MAG: hypothetical protein E7671_03380 [Ruminococcaceae bacterium]|nr:hypothetical protein [Oscillospiraceae bacterium]